MGAKSRCSLNETRDKVGVAVVHAPEARIAACGRLRKDGAAPRNHSAIKLSKIMQPNAELGMNGQWDCPKRDAPCDDAAAATKTSSSRRLVVAVVVANFDYLFFLLTLLLTALATTPTPTTRTTTTLAAAGVVVVQQCTRVHNSLISI